MIGTFWSMCRACPSMPVDKLHSEYRSTYRWHEYTGPRQEIIRRPPQGLTTGQVQEPALHRRKKHPELAYKTHDFISDSGSEALLGKTFLYDRARSEERWASSHEKNSRRSKSEGPPAGKPLYRLISTKPINIPNRSTAYTKNKQSYFNDENEAPKNSNVFNNCNNIIQTEALNSLPTKGGVSEKRIHLSRSPISNVLNTRIDDIYSQSTPKKSISMNGLKNKEANPRETVPVHRKTAGLKNKSDLEVLQTIKANPESDNINMDDSISKYDDTDGEFKSEYKKNFQPFNKYDYDENKGVFEKRTGPISAINNQNETESPSSSWYKEVVLLRQKANQYRHRGWGTELVPDHIARLYNDQMMVWEQVSRRSTLSALSLASTVLSRNGSPSKEEKENRKNSPVKSLSRARSAKASHTIATHHGKSTDRKSGGHVKGSASKPQRELSPKKGNNQVKKLGIKRTSSNKTSRESESAVGTPPTVHKIINQGSEKPKRRPRPTSLITSVPSGSKTVQLKKKEKTDGEVEDFPTIDQEQIVKSPPEPTRVKSPEQIVIRSPEPVNWTVPLDTGKTFTVTQNIREGDLAPRSYSEVRAWTPNSAPPPPASISAPTELIELAKTNIKGEILTK